MLVFAIHPHESTMCAHVSHHPESPFHLPPHPIPLDCPRVRALDALLHALNLHWTSMLHMVMYMLQCYSLKSSHPHPLPLTPEVYSLCLCLLGCPAHKIVSTIFLILCILSTRVAPFLSGGSPRYHQGRLQWWEV